MPKYDYKCKCGNRVTIEKRMIEATREEFCEKCNSKLQRIFDATPNKWNCSGAYVTDNK